MDLEQVREPDLLLICEELGIEVRKIQRKPLLVKAIQDSGADEKEIKECWELIEERKAAREAEREAEERRAEREAEERRAEREREAEEKRAEREERKIRLEAEEGELKATWK